MHPPSLTRPCVGKPLLSNQGTVSQRGKVQAPLEERQRVVQVQLVQVVLAPPSHLHGVSHYCFRKLSFAHIGQPPLAVVPIVGSNMLVVAGCVLVIDVLVVIQQRGETMDERGQLAGARRYY